MVSAHREENIDSSNFINLVDSINLIAQNKLPIIISTHPEPEIGLMTRGKKV